VPKPEEAHPTISRERSPPLRSPRYSIFFLGFFWTVQGQGSNDTSLTLSSSFPIDAQPRSPLSLPLLPSMHAAAFTGQGRRVSPPPRTASSPPISLLDDPRSAFSSNRCAAAHPPSPRRRHFLPRRPPNPPRIRWTAVFAGQGRRRLVYPPPLQSLSWTTTQRRGCSPNPAAGHRPCWTQRQLLRSGGHRAPPDDLVAGGDD
jgi:hypothetical protein